VKLTVEAMRLTSQEVTATDVDIAGIADLRAISPAAICDAQLRKALRMVYDWLNDFSGAREIEDEFCHDNLPTAIDVLESILTQGGIL
jgi:hypothetical protein